MRLFKRQQPKPTGRDKFNGLGQLAASALAIGWLAVNVFDGCKAIKDDVSKDSKDGKESKIPNLGKDKAKEPEGAAEKSAKSEKSDKSDKEEGATSEEETVKDASEEETPSEETASPKKKTKPKKA